MLGALAAAREAGADVAQMNPWDRDGSFSILHMWGLESAHYPSAYWANQAGKAIVFSALFPYSSPLRRIRHWGLTILGQERTRMGMIPWISALTVVNSLQADYARHTLGVPADRIHVIPNIIEDQFFDPAVGGEPAPVSLERYVLCTGNICRRKDQLTLVRACRRLGVPLLLVGSVLTGEEAYGQAVADAMAGRSDMQWIRGLPAGSPELAATYHGAAAFALPSHREQQPISALEAAAAGVPLVLGDRAYARQEFYANAALASPGSEISVANALRKALDAPQRHQPPRETLERCRRATVGAAYAALYAGIIERQANMTEPR
ncbi:MAG TPA: glycosyltransferase family 4 protein [Aliidongia sp.]|uniref:glycosyltransferase family 4 protein n=1 Tax=Aliidongia sp. TaxID=1914230 RepID=UPI002DDC9301|nr:glycosyltransferase family 4 protein [Aliidongia sp.]HEV2674625.1 glycosyltransferase family 4 protein [Aliidongia sp.]